MDCYSIFVIDKAKHGTISDHHWPLPSQVLPPCRGSCLSWTKWQMTSTASSCPPEILRALFMPSRNWPTAWASRVHVHSFLAAGWGSLTTPWTLRPWGWHKLSKSSSAPHVTPSMDFRSGSSFQHQRTGN